MIINEEKLKLLVKTVVNEAVIDEVSKSKHKKNPKKKKKTDEEPPKNPLRKYTGGAPRSKRKNVIKWLKSPSLNNAEVMRKLWKPGSKDEEASARSYFYKCRDGKKNDSGEPYRFTDKDINTLYGIKNREK